jgi:hypothetical protein
VGRDDEVGDREVNDGVTEKFQSFVGLALVFGGVTRMGHGDGQQRTGARETHSLG